MGIEYESVVDHPLDEVWAWHARPGAIHRLMPPWQPMKVLAESQSLADGRAVLGLPGGLRWVARHDPAEFDPPHRFVDVLSTDGPLSWPARVVGWWRHTHEFSAAVGGTRVHDRVDTTVPARLLRATFVYRHRQLADDLAAHRDAGSSPMVVAISDASGLVGTALSAFLSTGGHTVIPLVKGPADLSGVDAVVHLSGAPIDLTKVDGPRAFVFASTIGDDDVPISDAGLRVVQVRTGQVVSARGGWRQKKRPASPWIALDDLLDVYYRALYDTRLSGPVDAVAPSGTPPSQLELLGHRFRHPRFSQALAHELGHG